MTMVLGMGRSWGGHCARVALLAAALLPIPMAGCTFSKRVGSDPVEFNKSFADANNRLLLLNIARASRNHPLYFSEITELNQSLKASAGLESEIPWADTPKSITITPSLGVEGGPDFTISPLTSREFFTGLTTQVAPSTLKYYWDQGWPRTLLLRLLVREIYFEGLMDKEGRPVRLRGAFDFFACDPAAGYREFSTAVDLLAQRELNLVDAPEPPEAIGPALAPDVANPDTLRALVEADKEGYTLQRAGSHFTLHGEAATVLKFDRVLTAEDLNSLPTVRDAFAAANRTPEVRAALLRPSAGPPKIETTHDVTVSLFLRSPEAILYHLGEIVRAERTLGFQTLFTRGRGAGRVSLPLFSASGCGPCGTSVCYCGATYTVSGDPQRDESMHVLSFLNQLIMLQKDAKDAPKSRFVRVIGGR